MDEDHLPAAAAPADAVPVGLRARRLGIETLHEAQVFLHKDCIVSRSEGFSSHARVLVRAPGGEVVANLYHVHSDLVGCDEAGFSDAAWARLDLKEGDLVQVSHAAPIESFSRVRGKVFGRPLDEKDLGRIIADIAVGYYSNIQLSAFVTACAARPLDFNEMCALTRAMVDAGEAIQWEKPVIVDKHSIGGLPGNRTTPIVVAIAAAAGLTIPKTSSRAITSPAGTADMMETLAPVNLTVAEMRRVVDREGGCIIWGGAVCLSPTDDILIRVERVLDLDAEGQLVASILSKKLAAGSNRLVLDLPVGPTAKVRSNAAAHALSQSLIGVAKAFGIEARAVISDGTQPVGRGIGPALEAWDVLGVLRNEPRAAGDLSARALTLAGHLLELGGAAREGEGEARALAILKTGEAWAKFQAICEAQGGMREPPVAEYRHVIEAARSGRVNALDNRRLAKIAKLAGAPEDKAAGLVLDVRLGDEIVAGQPLYTIHAQSPGELSYALNYARDNADLIALAEI
jgi:thymidine phosphorylase